MGYYGNSFLKILRSIMVICFKEIPLFVSSENVLVRKNNERYMSFAVFLLSLHSNRLKQTNIIDNY